MSHNYTMLDLLAYGAEDIYRLSELMDQYGHTGVKINELYGKKIVIEAKLGLFVQVSNELGNMGYGKANYELQHMNENQSLRKELADIEKEIDELKNSCVTHKNQPPIHEKDNL